MKKNNRFLVIACFVAFIVIAWLYKPSEEADVWVSASVNTVSSSLSSRLQVVSSYSSVSSISVSEPAKKVSTENSQPADYSSDFATIEADKILERMKNDPTYNSYFQTQLEYESEPYEKNWAERRVVVLTGLLQSQYIGDDIKIKNLSCRSKSCQIQIMYKTEDNVQKINQYLAMNVFKGELNGLLLPYIRTTFDQNTSSAIMYMTDVQP